MSDIVQRMHEFRVRNAVPGKPINTVEVLKLLGEAILEIEQLRAKVQRLQESQEGMV